MSRITLSLFPSKIGWEKRQCILSGNCIISLENKSDCYSWKFLWICTYDRKNSFFKKELKTKLERHLTVLLRPSQTGNCSTCRIQFSSRSDMTVLLCSILLIFWSSRDISLMLTAQCSPSQEADYNPLGSAPCHSGDSKTVILSTWIEFAHTYMYQTLDASSFGSRCQSSYWAG